MGPASRRNGPVMRVMAMPGPVEKGTGDTDAPAIEALIQELNGNGGESPWPGCALTALPPGIATLR
jgi:hypothetical protein